MTADLFAGASDSARDPISLILKDGSEFFIPWDVIDRFSKAYPSVNVPEQLRIASAWCYSNPARRKTRKGLNKFINNWLRTSHFEQKRQPGAVFSESHRIAEKPNLAGNSEAERLERKHKMAELRQRYGV